MINVKSLKKGKENILPEALLLGGLFAVSGILYIKEELEDLSFAQYRIDSFGKLKHDVRAVYLVDLHNKSFGEENERLISMIDEADPDVVLMGGDMITVGNEIKDDETLKLCRKLAEKYPVYYANGNHEQRLRSDISKYGNAYIKYIELLRSFGIKCLTDTQTQMTFGENITISSLELETPAYRRLVPSAPGKEELDNKIGKSDESGFNILLAHSPEFLQQYAKTGANLVLSGHYHGGTVRLGEKTGLMTPQLQLFKNNVTGHKRFGRTDMVISSGLGTHTFNIRINNKPQVVVVDITK